MAHKRNIVYSSGMFGEYSPYYYLKDGKVCIAETMAEVVSNLPEDKPSLDVASVLSLLNFNYILGDRTLVSGVSKVPWHSDIMEDGTVDRRPPLPHNSMRFDEKTIAARMHDYLSEYLYKILEKHRTIWLTLSGGYDSRVVAGILNEVSSGRNEIRVLTWGLEQSRDVVYSRKIAEHFDWEFIYLPFYEGYLSDMIGYAVKESGAENSPLDYNAIETNASVLEKIAHEDGIVFAHYGDSVGRALYQGVHLSDIHKKKIRNPFGLFNISMFSEYKKVIEADRASAWQMDGSSEDVKAVAAHELDMHENYMRRTLTKRFKYCRKYDPFTSEGLVRFVYSLAVDCRTSGPYMHLLKDLDDFLYEMPYANTGVAFSGQVEEIKSLLGRQHDKFTDFQDMSFDVCDKLFNGMLVENRVINKGALKYILKAWRRDVSLSHLISRLYGVEKFIETYGVMPRSLRRRFYDDGVSMGMARAYHGAKWLKRTRVS